MRMGMASRGGDQPSFFSSVAAGFGWRLTLLRTVVPAQLLDHGAVTWGALVGGAKAIERLVDSAETLETQNNHCGTSSAAFSGRVDHLGRLAIPGAGWATPFGATVPVTFERAGANRRV